MAIDDRTGIQELRMMQEHMSRLLDMNRDRCGGDPVDEEPWQPPVDIFEDDHQFVIMMEVPEIDQQDIEVQIEDYTLIISGHRRLSHEDRRQHYHRIERRYGRFCRSFALPATVDPVGTRASCEQGVLRVSLPQKSPAAPRQIEVDVE